MIRVRTLLACLALVVLPGVVSAQTPFYGTLSCDEASAVPRKSAIADIGTTAGGSARQKDSADPKDGPRAKKGTDRKPTAAAANGIAGNRATEPKGEADAHSAPGLPAVVSQETCSWSLPLLIGKDMALQAENTINSNVAGSHSTDTGSHTSHTTNSEQFTMSLSGTSIFDGGRVRSRQGTWTLTGGTGTLNGISGSGTYTAVAKAQGGISYDIEGGYQLPSAVPTVPSASPAPSSPPAPMPPSDVSPS